MDKEILNMDEAAELFSVSVKTFIKLLKEEKVPGRKIGREWRFSRAALVNWLSSGDSQAYSSSESETKDFFNSVAADWEHISSGYYDRSVRNRLLESKLLKKGMKVLDLGAGDGFLSRAIAGYVKKVVAVDISAEMLKELKLKADEEGRDNIEVIECDGRDIPLPDGSVDLICSNMYLHHIDDPETAVREMKRLLKPEGRVFLADLKEHSNRELKDRMHDAWQGFSADELKGWFTKNGFKDIVVEFFGDEKKNAKGRADEGVVILTAVR
ncbi:MAG: methyltransferase domain-containing protein [Clostridiales bacterium]|nr:methyltransferase domain-containing protein [Clostridiales bacterium]